MFVDGRRPPDLYLEILLLVSQSLLSNVCCESFVAKKTLISLYSKSLPHGFFDGSYIPSNPIRKLSVLYCLLLTDLSPNVSKEKHQLDIHSSLRDINCLITTSKQNSLRDFFVVFGHIRNSSLLLIGF